MVKATALDDVSQLPS